MAIVSIRPSIAALYFDGASEAQTVGAARLKVTGFTGVKDPASGEGDVVPTAGTSDRIVIRESGWYRVSYHINGTWGATADGATFSVTAGAGADSVLDADVLPGSEDSFVSLTGQLDGQYNATTLAYLKANAYVTLCQIQYSAGGTFTITDGTLVVEKIQS